MASTSTEQARGLGDDTVINRTKRPGGGKKVLRMGRASDGNTKKSYEDCITKQSRGDCITKKYRPHKTLTVRVRADQGGQWTEREERFLVIGKVKNKGTPFEYWEYRVPIWSLQKRIAPYDWSANWDHTAFVAMGENNPIAYAKVLDQSTDTDDVKEFTDREETKTRKTSIASLSGRHQL